MLYYFPQYKKYFYIATGWACIFILLRYKEIDRLIDGDASNALIFLLVLQIIFIPLLFVLAGFYTRDITVTTDDRGIKYKSWFKRIDVKWNEIRIVQREGWWIRVRADHGSFSVSPLIASSSSAEKIEPKVNIFMKCELLKEIGTKAKSAEFKGFPRDTFTA